MSPVSATYFGIPGYAIFWVMFIIAFGLFAKKLLFLYRIMCLGKQENRFDGMGERIKNMLFAVIPQWCSLKSVTKKDLAGLGHALLFWGFSFFLISYIVFIGLAEGLGLYPYLMDNAFSEVYFSILDFAGIFVIISIVWAAIRRYIVKPERLEISVEAGVIMIMVFSLMALHFCTEAFGIAGSGNITAFPPVSSAIARFLSGTGISNSAMIEISHGAWWLHYALILGFMVYIPRSKHLHVLAAAFNVLFSPLGPKVVLEAIPLEALESEEPPELGLSRIQDLKWKDMLDLYACAVCGRCHVNCPANLSGKSLSPREVIHDLKEHVLEDGPGLLAGRRRRLLKARERP